MVLYVARTFLTCFHERQTVLLYILAKIIYYLRLSKLLPDKKNNLVRL